MINREKVIKGLECCHLDDDGYPVNCKECPYGPSGIRCAGNLNDDALELLKAMELKKVRFEDCGYAFTEEIMEE